MYVIVEGGLVRGVYDGSGALVADYSVLDFDILDGGEPAQCDELAAEVAALPDGSDVAADAETYL